MLPRSYTIFICIFTFSSVNMQLLRIISVALMAVSALGTSYATGKGCKLSHGFVSEDQIEDLSRQHGLTHEQCGQVLIDLDDIRGNWGSSCKSIAQKRGCDVSKVIKLVGTCQTMWHGIYDQIFNGLKSEGSLNLGLEGSISVGGSINVGGSVGVTGSVNGGYQVISTSNSGLGIWNTGLGFGGKLVCGHDWFKNQFEGSIGLSGSVCEQIALEIADLKDNWLEGVKGIAGRHCNGDISKVIRIGTMCGSQWFNDQGHPLYNPFHQVSICQGSVSGSTGGQVIVPGGSSGNGQVIVSNGGNQGCIFNNGQVYVGNQVVVDGGWLSSNAGQWGLSRDGLGQVIYEVARFPTGGNWQEYCRSTAAKYRTKAIHIVNIAGSCKSRFNSWSELYNRFDKVSGYGGVFQVDGSVTSGISISSSASNKISTCSKKLGLSNESWEKCFKGLFGTSKSWGYSRLATDGNGDQIANIMGSITDAVSNATVTDENAADMIQQTATALDVDMPSVSRVALGMYESLLDANATDSTAFTGLNSLAGVVTASANTSDSSMTNSDSAPVNVIASSAFNAAVSVSLAAFFALMI
ncbi:hypothetical protein BC830DRAFT_636695 [Chytriomyces sp. MP71]|nr:hypothetical protein BC830DRAFT_636695 [Chytriomyces sp. MP71]